MAQKLVHGGDWAGFEGEYGRMPLDFSANVSPLGLPETVAQALAASAATAHLYPDPLCRRLREALGSYFDCPAENIFCGNGAADIIWRLGFALRPRRALVTAPTFAEYEAAMTAAGCRVEQYVLREEQDFALTEDILEAIVPGVELVFLCQPNNPTGRTVPPALIEKVLHRCRAAGAVLVLDECFVDFLDDPASVTCRGLLSRWPELVILGAFTKLWAMAGLRLGWALCGDRALPQKLAAAGQPWAVSGPAQQAGLAALADREYPRRVRALIAAQRPVLTAGLRALGLRVVEGSANFLLFQSPVPLAEPLRRRGVLVRGCGNYRGLDDSWYRTAVRTGPENQQLLQALAEVLQAEQKEKQ